MHKILRISTDRCGIRGAVLQAIEMKSASYITQNHLQRTQRQTDVNLEIPRNTFKAKIVSWVAV